MTHEEVSELLKNFENGWILCGSTLVLWEHDEDPPAPLTRPELPDAVA